jgi:acyl carrier protein
MLTTTRRRATGRTAPQARKPAISRKVSVERLHDRSGWRSTKTLFSSCQQSFFGFCDSNSVFVTYRRTSETYMIRRAAMPTTMIIEEKIIEEKLKHFMTQQFLFEFDEVTITADTNLFAAGYIDSFGFVELVSFIEAEWQIKFTDEELLSNQLNSLANLVRVIEGKQQDDH